MIVLSLASISQPTDSMPTEFVTVGIIVLACVAAVLGLAALDVKNRGVSSTPGIGLLRFSTRWYTRCMHGLQPGGEDPLPASGAVIVVANHRSGVDPFAVQFYSDRVIRFMMAREYYCIPLISWFFRLIGCIPVNRDGNDFAATKSALKALRGGDAVGIFPQGGIRHEDVDAPIDLEQDGESVKHGAAMLALKTGAPVVAAYIDGTPPKDSVFLAFLIPSRSRVVFSAPEVFTPAREGKPSREDLETASRRIVESLEDLRRSIRAETEEPASGVAM